MRFAYIDSNGNEVPIPSVDALALRIELGAISEDTELYDAQADLWGPAHTHEIFQSLSRTSGGDSGFVAPPPVVPPPPAPKPSTQEADVAQDTEPGEVSVAETGEPDDDLTLAVPDASAEESAGEGVSAAEADESDGEAGGLLDLDLDLAPSESDADEGSALDGAVPGSDATEDDEEDEGAGVGSFDFGDMDGGLQMEDEPDEGDESVTKPTPGGTAEGGGSPDFSGGLESESSMDFGSGDFDAAEGAPLQLETPMSEFSPESPPSWMESGGGGSEDTDDVRDVMDFSSASGESEADEATDDVHAGEGRTPRSKPSAPKHRRQYSLVGPLLGVVAVLAVGVGGYLAWPVLSARLSRAREPAAPSVFIPELRSELMPQMRSVADAALAAVFEDVRRGWASSNSVTSPSSDWLAGVYLGNAGQFDNVEAFWIGMEDYLVGVEAIDLAAFDAALRVEMGPLGVTDADAALVLARADSGFVAGGPDRAAVHDRVETLIAAALDLHAFLVANESNIEHVPASSSVTDPVLEASANTPEIRTAMEDRIDSVTGALADMGYFDAVTFDDFWTAVLAQVQEVSVR